MFKELAFLIIIILPFFLLRFLRSELQIKGPLANAKAGKANKKKKKKSKKPQDAGNVSGSGTNDAIKKNNIDDEKEKSKKKNKAEKENILSAKNNEKDSDKPKISVKTGSPIKVVVSASEEDDNNDVLVNDDQEEYEQVTEDDFVHVSATKKKGATAKRKGFNVQEADFPPLPSGSRIQSDSQEPTREIDSYMDPAYFKQHRVMRIVPEENKKSNAPNRQNSSSQSINEPLSKTQRKNQARAAKRKEEARLKEELQAERLRQHQRELEKERRKEFDKNSKPKSTAGSKGSKSSEATASVNEAGQLVWD